MRISLEGTMFKLDPIVLTFDETTTFDPTSYTALGYTHFDVICIGGGGGQGGGINTGAPHSGTRTRGGAGGGGGFHRVLGLLSSLLSSVDVIVGEAGPDGLSDDDIFGLTVGQDGGYSSFNDTACRASGGIGGEKGGSSAYGGDGGIGDSITAGGGGVGAPLNTAGEDGTILSNIGEGGGGGSGGIQDDGGTGDILRYGTPGGRGSYSLIDSSVFGNGDFPNTIDPGAGGGATTFPLSGRSIQYGKGGTNGIVVLRLTSE